MRICSARFFLLLRMHRYIPLHNKLTFLDMTDTYSTRQKNWTEVMVLDYGNVTLLRSNSSSTSVTGELLESNFIVT